MSPAVKDLAVRALHTFWQAFVGTVGAGLTVGGISLSGIHSMDDAKAIVGVVLAIVYSAGASALKTTVASLLKPSDEAAIAVDVLAALQSPAPAPVVSAPIAPAEAPPAPAI